MKKYLQLGRLHTSPLETVPAIIGAALATGTLFHPAVLIWGVYGFLYHVAGYSHNSCTDYHIGGDINDPNKQHHPLNDGRLDYENAIKYVTALMVGLAIYSMWAVAYMQDGVVALALGVAIIVQVLFGVGYNLLNNTTDFKFLLITVSHTLVFFIPYVASGGEFNSVFLSLLAFVFLWVTFQISVSGEIKDILIDESNLMTRMGTRVHEHTSLGDNRLYPSTGSIVWSLMIHVFMAVSLFPIILENARSRTYHMLALCIAYFIMVYLGSRITDSGKFNRDKRVANMALVELLALSIFIMSSAPYIQEGMVMLLIPISLVWVVVFNNIQWSTGLRPDV